MDKPSSMTTPSNIQEESKPYSPKKIYYMVINSISTIMISSINTSIKEILIHSSKDPNKYSLSSKIKLPEIDPSITHITVSSILQTPPPSSSLHKLRHLPEQSKDNTKEFLLTESINNSILFQHVLSQNRNSAKVQEQTINFHLLRTNFP